MKKLFLTLCVLAAIAAAALLGWHFTHRQAALAGDAGDSADKPESEGVAQVRVAPIERKAITEKIVRYGTVVAQPGKIHSVSVAFEARVRHILVAPGQFVRAGDPLVEIEPSPAAQLQLQQARNAASAAQRDLAQTQERYNLKLATNQELGAAQKAAADTDLQLASLRKQGLGGDGRLYSDMAGLVGKVDAQDGQIVATGGPLVEIVAEEDIEVKLGVEAEDLRALKPGQPVALFPVDDAGAGKVDAAIRIVTGGVDPATRLVNVYVSLPKGIKLLLDEYVRGEITRSSEQALVVPTTALLPAPGGFSLFTVKDKHAVNHIVQTGLENDHETEVIASGLDPGEKVVVAGNYELEDGMSVEAAGSK